MEDGGLTLRQPGQVRKEAAVTKAVKVIRPPPFLRRILMAEEENKDKGFLNFIKENKVTVIILSIVIVAAGVGTTVVIVERKRRRVV